MAPETPDVGLDAQDQAEIFDETNLDDDAEFVTLEEMPDVYDATQALGDGREVRSFDAADLDAEALDDEEDDDIDDEDLDAEDGVDPAGRDEVELAAVADVDAATNIDDEDEADYESEDLSDDDLEDLGYADGDDDDQSKGAGGSRVFICASSGSSTVSGSPEKLTSFSTTCEPSGPE